MNEKYWLKFRNYFIKVQFKYILLSQTAPISDFTEASWSKLSI